MCRRCGVSSSAWRRIEWRDRGTRHDLPGRPRPPQRLPRDAAGAGHADRAGAAPGGMRAVRGLSQHVQGHAPARRRGGTSGHARGNGGAPAQLPARPAPLTVRSTRTGAHFVVDALIAAGVRYLFSVSGNHILSIYDATIGRELTIVHTRHEAAAVHMADAWGRITETPGVALVTAGPGHLNAMSALYGALMAESPVVLLSGHAPLGQAGRGAFQEMDQVAAARPVTKAAWLAGDAARLGDDIRRALA